jgi:hypothetical protein
VAGGKFLMVALSNASGIAGGTAQLAVDGRPGDGWLELVVSAATGRSRGSPTRCAWRRHPPVPG